MTARPGPRANAARILIVDDEPDNRELMQLILNWEGFATVMAASGEEALVIARDEPVDLVLLDLMMPGLDGFEVTTRMKRSLITRRIPIVVLSALDDHAAKKRVLDAGAAEFASKPIDRSDLCARVRRVLGNEAERRAQRSTRS
jgi:DNA-binding response OmpR family regulator